MSVSGPQITHVIFDLDGLLLDSETIYTKVNRELMKSYGREYTMELKAKTTGMKMDDAIQTMLEHVLKNLCFLSVNLWLSEHLIGTISLEEYRTKYLDLLGKYLPESRLLPGAMRLVKHLAKYKIPTAICSGSNTFEFDAKMKNHKELFDLIPLHVLNGDDPHVKKGKPAPDGFLETVRRFSVKPKSAAHVLVFEDSINGVYAALAAGMHVVVVPDLRYSSPSEKCKDKTKSMLKITHVIFDLDGLLIDTEIVFSKVNQCLLSKYGKEFTSHLRGLVTGMPKKAAVTFILEHEKLSGKVDVDEYCKKYDEMAEEMLPKCSLMPGVLKILRHLKAHNIPMAICTGSTRKEFELKTRHQKELLDLISLRVLSGDDPAIKRGKPAPDAYLVTMDRFEQKPEKAENVLVFEDATNGVYAAIAAGMRVVMVPDLTFMKIPDELHNKITSILQSLEDFKPENMGLPAYS
uniref:Haloacid dehalogenase-like hydrolase domain-containing protein Sgpp n=1 Tax=Elaeophora elaphi TaxID=1147741 RepID=A0A0R3RSM5_9BILA